jgi:outer membrane protein TolC
MRKLFVSALILISVLISPFNGLAQEAGELRLRLTDAIEMAIKTSEDVQTQAQNLEIAEQSYGIAVSQALPHLNSEVAYNYYPGKQNVDVSLPGMAPVSFSMQKNFDLAAGVTLSQNIFTFGKIRNAIKAAKYGKKAAFYNEDNARREIGYNTAIAYVSVLLAQESIKIAKNSYNNAMSTKKILKDKYSYGRIPQSDNIKSSADVAIRIPSLKNAEKDLDLAMRDLTTLIGYFGSEKVVLTDLLVNKFPEYNIETTLNAMYDIEPRLKMLKESVAMTKYSAKAERAKLLPTLFGVANYTYFGQSDNFDLTDKNTDNIGTLGVMLKIPLWNGGVNWRSYKIAKHENTKSELALQKIHKYLTRDLKNSISEYESLLDVYAANVEAVSLSNKSFEVMQDRFASGGMTITELNDQEIQLTNAKLSKALTLFRINRSIITIERLTSGGKNNVWQKRYLRE